MSISMANIKRVFTRLTFFMFVYIVLSYHIAKIEIENIDLWQWHILIDVLVIFTIEVLLYFTTFYNKNILVLVFLILTFLFHFSHLLLIALDYSFETTTANLPMVRFGNKAAKEAFQVCLLFQFANFTGFYIYDVFTRTNKIQKMISLKIEHKRLIAHIILGIGCITWLYRNITVYSNTVSYGYGNTAMNSTEVYLIILTRFFLVGLIMEIMITKTEYMKRIILLFGTVLFIISLFTGERAFSLISLCILSYVYMKRHGDIKIKFRYFVFLIIIGYNMSILLNVIRLVRGGGMGLGALTSEISAASTLPVYALINEFGISANVIALVCTQHNLPHDGMQFLTSFLIVIPGISYFFSYDLGAFSLAYRLNAWNLGGSFIADFFYDFGYWGFLFSLSYGVVIAKFFNYFDKIIRQKSALKVAAFSPVLLEVMLSIRSTTYKMPRMITIYFILFSMFCMISIIFHTKSKECTK